LWIKRNYQCDKSFKKKNYIKFFKANCGIILFCDYFDKNLSSCRSQSQNILECRYMIHWGIKRWELFLLITCFLRCYPLWGFLGKKYYFFESNWVNSSAKHSGQPFNIIAVISLNVKRKKHYKLDISSTTKSSTSLKEIKCYLDNLQHFHFLIKRFKCWQI
jgi:hypothetical protein